MPITQIQIQTIDYCSRSCRFCPQKEDVRKTKELMPKKMFYNIIEQAKALPRLCGIKPYLMNEPFSDKRIFSFLQYIFKELPKKKVFLQTNCDYLKEKETFYLFKQVVSNPQLYTQLNIYDEETKQWAQDVVLPEGNWQWKQRIFSWKQLYNRGGNLKDYETEAKRGRCRFLYRYANINYRGEIIHCCSDYRFESILGTVERGIQNSYKGLPWRRYRRLFNTGKMEKIPLCRKCNIYGKTKR